MGRKGRIGMTHTTLARRLAEESAVLLKNEGLLPFAPGQRLAVFGRTQCEPILSGNGSGASYGKGDATFLTALEQEGLVPVAALREAYAQLTEEDKRNLPPEMDFSQMKHVVNSGLMYEIFGQYTPTPREFLLPKALLDQAAGETDTALWIVGRKSGGEECDRRMEGDYALSQEEQILLQEMCARFPKVAVVLNVNGLLDLSWVETYPQVKALLFVGIPGEEGPAAVANLLAGSVTPSGKLVFTIARRYEEYPAYRDFSWDKNHPEAVLTYEDYGLTPPPTQKKFLHRPVTVYREGLYLGYRYFDSFGVEPLFPFGFGLSYTSFGWKICAVEKQPAGVAIRASVKNTGGCAGKETLQLYVSPFGTSSEQPVQMLKAFAKTELLAPGQEETLTLSVPWREMAAYEESRAAWVIEKGTYLLRLGVSSRQTRAVGAVEIPEDILAEQVSNRLAMAPGYEEQAGFLHRPPSPVPALEAGLPRLTVEAKDVPRWKAPDVSAGDVSRLSDRQLAALCVGYGPGVSFSAFRDVPEPNTIFEEDGSPVTVNDHPEGVNGYVSPAIPQEGIHSVYYKDGPAGIGETAWPGEMLLACSFDRKLLSSFGRAVAEECRAQGVDVWLAPALNLHRHPLGGRSFEYYSEDPFLAGACACAVLKGVQGRLPVLACAKHLAANEQETYRRGSAKTENGACLFDAVDSILPERVLRELYLKPFERAVKEGGLHCIMTSFNKINGVFAGGSKDLCTHILREEWGFDGAVVTDWGDMDIVVDGADAVAAGNDVVMPGGPPVIAQIFRGLEEGRLTRREMELAVGHLLSMVGRLKKGDCPHKLREEQGKG